MQSEGEASPDGSRTATSNLFWRSRNEARRCPVHGEASSGRRAPQGFADINKVIPREKLEEVSLRYKRLAGFNNDSLKSLRPLTISLISSGGPKNDLAGGMTTLTEFMGGARFR